MGDRKALLTKILNSVMAIARLLVAKNGKAEIEELIAIEDALSQIELLYAEGNLELSGLWEINNEVVKELESGEARSRDCSQVMMLIKKELGVLNAYLAKEEYPDKKIIRIKYVDFYPEFVPENHWLYKLLAKKYIILFDDNPDYLIYSCFGTNYLKYDCLRIFISNEAVYPDFNVADYSVTYSDFEVNDRLLPNQDAFEDLEVQQMANSREEAELLLKTKSEFCNFVFSNGNASIIREQLLDELNKYKKVISGGKYRNNTGYLVDDLKEFQSHFKFSFACENSFYLGYTTEKIINAFNAKTIPIYWGNPFVSDIINPKSFIDVNSYETIEAVVDEIIRLDNDDDAYMEMLTQPILIDREMPLNYLKKREEFIYHIFDQDYDFAFRRNTGLRGQWHNDWLCYLNNYPSEWFSKEKNYFIKGDPEKIYNGPLVSILIPVFNREKIIEETIDCALKQTYKDIEIIIVDNCSSDNTYEIISKKYMLYDNVHIFRNSTNIGPVYNWQECLSKAKGEYLKILWSDDLISEDFVAASVVQLEKDREVGLVFTATEIFSDADNFSWTAYKHGRSGVRSCAEFYDGILKTHKDFPVSPGCALFRTEDVKILDEIPNEYGVDCNKNGAGIDLMVFLHALSRYEKYYYLEDVYSGFRFHTGSITATNNLNKEYLLGKKYFVDNYEVGHYYKPIIDEEYKRIFESGMHE